MQSSQVKVDFLRYNQILASSLRLHNHLCSATIEFVISEIGRYVQHIVL
jgi:hypothetical protein